MTITPAVGTTIDHSVDQIFSIIPNASVIVHEMGEHFHPTLTIINETAFGGEERITNLMINDAEDLQRVLTHAIQWIYDHYDFEAEGDEPK